MNESLSIIYIYRQKLRISTTTEDDNLLSKLVRGYALVYVAFYAFIFYHYDLPRTDFFAISHVVLLFTSSSRWFFPDIFVSASLSCVK